jgi:hypothetical protein
MPHKRNTDKVNRGIAFSTIHCRMNDCRCSVLVPLVQAEVCVFFDSHNDQTYVMTTCSCQYLISVHCLYWKQIQMSEKFPLISMLRHPPLLNFITDIRNFPNPWFTPVNHSIDQNDVSLFQKKLL